MRSCHPASVVPILRMKEASPCRSRCRNRSPSTSLPSRRVTPLSWLAASSATASCTTKAARSPEASRSNGGTRRLERSITIPWRPSVRRCATAQPSSSGVWPGTFPAALSSSITPSGSKTTRSRRWTSADGDGRSRASGTSRARHGRHERDRSSDCRPAARMWSHGAHDGSDRAGRFIRGGICGRRCRDSWWLQDRRRRCGTSTRWHRCHRTRRRWIVRAGRRLRRAGWSSMANRNRSESARCSSPGSSAASVDAGAALGRDRSHHINSESDAASWRDDRLRGGEGGPVELQQEPVEGIEPEGHPCGSRLARLGRDGWCGWTGQWAGGHAGHRLRRSTEDLDGFAWRHSHRAARSAEWGGRFGRVPRVAARRLHHRVGICHRRWHSADRLRFIYRPHRLCEIVWSDAADRRKGIDRAPARPARWRPRGDVNARGGRAESVLHDRRHRHERPRGDRCRDYAGAGRDCAGRLHAGHERFRGGRVSARSGLDSSADLLHGPPRARLGGRGARRGGARLRHEAAAVHGSRARRPRSSRRPSIRLASGLIRPAHWRGRSSRQSLTRLRPSPRILPTVTDDSRPPQRCRRRGDTRGWTSWGFDSQLGAPRWRHRPRRSSAGDGLPQPQQLRILQRAHRGDTFEVGVEWRRAYVRRLGRALHAQPVVVRTKPRDRSRDPARRSVSRHHLAPAAPPLSLNGRAIPLSMGKVLGGGSSINAMVWSRGHKCDWDFFASESGDRAGYESHEMRRRPARHHLGLLERGSAGEADRPRRAIDVSVARRQRIGRREPCAKSCLLAWRSFLALDCGAARA